MLRLVIKSSLWTMITLQCTARLPMMMHQTKNTVTEYVELNTDQNRTIVLSSYHLILTCDFNSVFSKDVQRNECVFIYIKGTMKKARVMDKRFSVGYTAYAPLTNKGTLIVNDVYTSCYAYFPSHTISHSAFALWRWIYIVLKIFNLHEVDAQYHWYPYILKTFINSLSPYRVWLLPILLSFKIPKWLKKEVMVFVKHLKTGNTILCHWYFNAVSTWQCWQDCIVKTFTTTFFTLF